MSTCCGWACIQQSNVGIIERFGEFADVIPPGASYIGCCTHTLKGSMSLRTRLMYVSTQSATADRVMLELKTVVMYHVIPSECHTAYYSLSSLDQIRSYVDNAMRGQIARCTYDAIFHSKEQISNEVRQMLRPELEHRGFEVDEILIKDIVVPRELRFASEQQLQNRYLYEANLHRAEANKIMVMKQAEAESEVKRLSGVGAAHMQMGVSAGFGDLVSRFQDGEQTSEIMAMILMQQYFDTLSQLGKSKGHTVFMPDLSIFARHIA